MFSTITLEEKNKIVELYQGGMGATGIAALIKRSETFIKYNLKKLGVPIRTMDKYRKYTLNPNYFDSIDTQEKAYWLGFLFADGCNYENRNEVKLCLKESDAHHIERFKLAIGANQPLVHNAGNIRDGTTQVTICNKNFSASLARLGCIQNKSLVLQFPKIPKKYLAAFMLGAFDGDGCICAHGPIFSVTGSYDFITGYQQALIDNCRLNKTKVSTKKELVPTGLREKAWSLRYCGKGNCQKIRDFLYSGRINCYLPRKHEKFEAILNDLTQGN